MATATNTATNTDTNTDTGTEAPAHMGVLNATDLIIREELKALKVISGDVVKMRGVFTYARSISWAMCSAGGTSDASLAEAWNVTDNYLKNVQYGVAVGTFLVKLGVTYEVKDLSDEARAMLAGRVLVSGRSVIFRDKDKNILSDDWFARLKKVTSAAGIKADANQKAALIRSWLESSVTLEGVENLRAAYIAKQSASDAEPANQKAAVAALALVQGKPDEDLLEQCRRIIALA